MFLTPGIDRPHFVYPSIHWWTCGLFPVWGYNESYCCGHSCSGFCVDRCSNSLDWKPARWVSGSYGNSMPKILRNCQIVLNLWLWIYSVFLENPRIPLPIPPGPASWAPAPQFSLSWPANHLPSTGLHHHGPEQGWLHRQEWSEGHLCCSWYVAPLGLQEGPSHAHEGPGSGTIKKVKSLSFSKETAQPWLTFKTNFRG